MDHLRLQTEFQDSSDKKRGKVNIVETLADFTPTSRTGTDDDEQSPKTFEKPKAVASSRKRDVLASWAVYHLPPLAVTAVMTVMYVQQWTWPNPGPSDETLAVLQFPAKIHECLIVASLSNIIFHRLRYLLLKTDGVPLGLVTTPFQLNNPLYYVGPEFLGALRKLSYNLSIFLTFNLVFLVALLAVAASPFSAVLLIPRQLIFALPPSHPLMESLLRRGFVFGPPDSDGTYLYDTLIMPVDRQYPMSLGSDLGATWTCPSLGNRQANCVSFFQDLFPDILSVALGANNDDFVPLPPDPANITITGAGLRLRVNNLEIRAEELTPLEPSGSGLTRATCPFRTAATALFVLQQGIFTFVDQNGTATDTISSLTWNARNKTIPNVQPQILAHTCLGSVTTSKISLEYLMSVGWDDEIPLDSTNYGNCFGTGFFPPWKFTMTASLATQLLQQNWTTGFLVFVDIQDQVPFPISGAYIRVAAKEASDDTIQNMDLTYFVGSWASAAPTAIRFFNGVPNSPIIPGIFTTPTNSLLNQSAPSSSSVVKMDAAWLNSLDIFPFQVIPTDNGFPRLDSESISLFTHITQTTNGVPSFLAAVMAAVHGVFGALPPGPSMCVSPNGKACYRGEDGERAIVYDLEQNVTGPARDLPENQVEIRVRIEQEAFGYKLEGTTVLLAFVFLYLHALLVVGHLVVMVVGGSWTSNAWTQLTDFVVLAMGSAPSGLLKNAGAGVTRWRTWAYLTSVRSVAMEQRLELVVHDELDEKGGSWELRGKVKPKRDVKYS